MITPVNNEFLLAPFIDLEINYALFSMHLDKSLDPDGMNLAFFQRNWHIVGHEVISTHLSIISNSTMPIGLNDTHMVLIPKKQNVECKGDLRPISLCNVL